MFDKMHKDIDAVVISTPDHTHFAATLAAMERGIRASLENLEIRWFMNNDFRLALLRDWKENGPEKVIDFTRYYLPASEPGDPGPAQQSRNWSLMNRINQKGTRPQDAPVTISELADEEKTLIRKHYPELLPTALR